MQWLRADKVAYFFSPSERICETMKLWLIIGIQTSSSFSDKLTNIWTGLHCDEPIVKSRFLQNIHRLIVFSTHILNGQCENFSTYRVIHVPHIAYKSFGSFEQPYKGTLSWIHIVCFGEEIFEILRFAEGAKRAHSRLSGIGYSGQISA